MYFRAHACLRVFCPAALLLGARSALPEELLVGRGIGRDGSTRLRVVLGERGPLPTTTPGAPPDATVDGPSREQPRDRPRERKNTTSNNHTIFGR